MEMVGAVGGDEGDVTVGTLLVAVVGLLAAGPVFAVVNDGERRTWRRPETEPCCEEVQRAGAKGCAEWKASDLERCSEIGESPEPHQPSDRRV